MWNINSFDQEGVQLGKILAKRALGAIAEGKSTRDGSLDALIAAVHNVSHQSSAPHA